MVDVTKLEAGAQQAIATASQDWNWLSQFVGKHPKTALIVFVLWSGAMLYIGHVI